MACTPARVKVWQFGVYIHAKISYNYDLVAADDPISVDLVSVPAGPEVNAAMFLSLTCQASGGTGIYTYQWSSTCASGCFLDSVNVLTRMVMRDAARATDSGDYTCVATDNAGNSGTNSIEIQVVGKFLERFSLSRGSGTPANIE
jgi:hypothetical protein